MSAQDARKRMEADWDKGFSALLSFNETWGHLDVPNHYHAPRTGLHLAVWMANRRAERFMLARKQVAQLDAIGFPWDVDEDALWEEGFAHFAACTASQSVSVGVFDMGGVRRSVASGPGHVPGHGYHLDEWMSTQFDNEEKLSPERVARLTALNFRFAARDASWGVMIGHLAGFHRQHGHVAVMRGYETDDGYALGRWVAARRKDRGLGLSPEQVAELDALGFLWAFYEIPGTGPWEERFAQWLAFREWRQAGNTIQGFRRARVVFIWANRQRRLRDRLHPSHVALLDAHGFSWDYLDSP